jgi:hypothetical protein
MNSLITPLHGKVEIYRVKDFRRILEYSTHNTIVDNLETVLIQSLLSRSANNCVDAIAWGSYVRSSGTYVDSDYAGTTSTGTKGSLIMSNPDAFSSKFSGTFPFSGYKEINLFELGHGYVPAAPGISGLFSSRYAADSSLYIGSTCLIYNAGEALIYDWTIGF